MVFVTYCYLFFTSESHCPSFSGLLSFWWWFVEGKLLASDVVNTPGSPLHLICLWLLTDFPISVSSCAFAIFSNFTCVVDWLRIQLFLISWVDHFRISIVHCHLLCSQFVCYFLNINFTILIFIQLWCFGIVDLSYNECAGYFGLHRNLIFKFELRLDWSLERHFLSIFSSFPGFGKFYPFQINLSSVNVSELFNGNSIVE